VTVSDGKLQITMSTFSIEYVRAWQKKADVKP
jgi:hypothetical protein